MWNRKESPHARIPVSHPPCTPLSPHSPPLLRPRLFILGRVHSCVGCSHRTPPPRSRDPMIFRPRGGSGCMQPGPRIAGPVWNCADREALDPTELSWSTPPAMCTLSSAEAQLSISMALRLHLDDAQQLQHTPHPVFDERLSPLDDQLFWRTPVDSHDVEEIMAVVHG